MNRTMTRTHHLALVTAIAIAITLGAAPAAADPDRNRFHGVEQWSVLGVGMGVVGGDLSHVVSTPSASLVLRWDLRARRSRWLLSGFASGITSARGGGGQLLAGQATIGLPLTRRSEIVDRSGLHRFRDLYVQFGARSYFGRGQRDGYQPFDHSAALLAGFATSTMTRSGRTRVRALGDAGVSFDPGALRFGGYLDLAMTYGRRFHMGFTLGFPDPLQATSYIGLEL